MTRASRGVIFVASGRTFFEEAWRSAASCKAVMPDIPISLWSDKDSLAPDSPFDVCKRLEQPGLSYIDKIGPLAQSPYSHTLFVDSDTYFLGSVYEIFDMLEHFDMAYAQSPVRISPWAGNHVLDIPACFPEPNTGVLAFKRCDPVLNVLSEWLEIYSHQLTRYPPPNHDQPALRLALYRSNLRTAVLPPEYNFRTIVPCWKGKSEVKILHGREPTLSRAIAAVNVSKEISSFDFR